MNTTATIGTGNTRIAPTAPPDIVLLDGVGFLTAGDLIEYVIEWSEAYPPHPLNVRKGRVAAVLTVDGQHRVMLAGQHHYSCDGVRPAIYVGPLLEACDVLGWFPHRSAARNVGSVQIAQVLQDVAKEVQVQADLFGHEDTTMPDGTGADLLLPGSLVHRRFSQIRDALQQHNNQTHRIYAKTRATVLLEEAFEAVAEDDAGRLYRELMQLSAIAVNWGATIELTDGDQP